MLTLMAGVVYIISKTRLNIHIVLAHRMIFIFFQIFTATLQKICFQYFKIQNFWYFGHQVLTQLEYQVKKLNYHNWKSLILVFIQFKIIYSSHVNTTSMFISCEMQIWQSRIFSYCWKNCTKSIIHETCFNKEYWNKHINLLWCVIHTI